MRRDNTLKSNFIIGVKLESFTIGGECLLIVIVLEETSRGFSKRIGCLAFESFFEITIGEFYSDFGIVGIKIGDLVQNFQSLFGFAGFGISVGYDQVLTTGIGGEPLSCV